MVSTEEITGLIKELANRISYSQLAKEVATTEDELKQWVTGKREYTPNEIWKLIRASSMHRLFELLPAHGIPPVSFDISAPFHLEDPPVGFRQEPPNIPLRNRPTNIAGHWVDFPLGLPASVLAANAKWIEFYARRGFDILTYKTVRTQYHAPHPWPNWVFLKDPPEIKDPSQPPIMIGYPGYWPEDQTTVSMANSFGVPSLEPEWWQKDVQRARGFVKEGHQVLIVSVVASVSGTSEAIAEDFAKAAYMAKKAGADIVEANYSCPNTPNDPAGEVYQAPSIARRVSIAMKEALEGTPLFVKIGYLTKPKLYEFVNANAEFVDGIVAINTISAEIVTRPVTGSAGLFDYIRALHHVENPHAFPDSGRERAGVSGWAIKARAQEVAENLVTIRQEIGTSPKKNFAILGLGGVLKPEDFRDRLAAGVDAVESCTGAFLDPYLGLKIRSMENLENL
jgi:dihydroorotate dehydrogenase